MKESRSDKRLAKNDIIVIAVILAVAAASWSGMRAWQRENAKAPTAVVTVDGAEFGRFLLREDVTEKIELPDGSYNILEIKNGKARVTEASCPDGICVNHRAVSRQGETIVCLPNKVVVEIQNGAEPDLDSITG